MAGLGPGEPVGPEAPCQPSQRLSPRRVLLSQAHVGDTQNTVLFPRVLFVEYDTVFTLGSPSRRHAPHAESDPGATQNNRTGHVGRVCRSLHVNPKKNKNLLTRSFAESTLSELLSDRPDLLLRVVAMEFPGIGVLSYATPSQDLRPFFARKVKTFFR